MKDIEQRDGFEGPPTNSIDPANGFTHSGQYVYKIFMQECGEGRMGWTVTSSSDTEVGVAFHYELDSETFDTTVTGSPEEVSAELLDSPAYPFLAVAFYPSITLFADEDEITVGDRISFPMEGGTGSVEITDTIYHAGLKCYTSLWKFNEVPRYRDCIAPESGLIFYAISYTKDGSEPLLKLEVLEHPSIEHGTDSVHDGKI